MEPNSPETRSKNAHAEWFGICVLIIYFNHTSLSSVLSVIVQEDGVTFVLITDNVCGLYSDN